MNDIIYILANDKHTSLFINAFMSTIKNYNHTFIVPKGDYKIDLMDSSYYKNLIEIDKISQLFTESKYKEILTNADKIIISGLFGKISYELPLLGKKKLSKTYLQFWGGDFYGYRNIKIFSKMWIKKCLFYYGIKRCKGIVNLIESDYKELQKVFPNKLEHFVGEMPEDSRCEEIIYKYIENKNKNNMIIVGNSATYENHQIEILEKLEKFKNYDIKICCPLSYGDREYGNKVAEVGEKIYGENFHPIFKYLSFEDYVKLLSSCSVGIFNNDRQQAMGNINILLKMGKKIYIRDDTAMWETYNNEYKFDIYRIKDIDSNGYDDFFKFDEDKGKSNREKIINKEKEWILNWNKILES